MGQLIKELPVIRHAWQKHGYIDIVGDHPVVENADNIIVRYGANDHPDIPGKAGFACIIKREDFLKKPDIINVDKMCAGDSKKVKEQMKSEIKKVRQLLSLQEK